MKKEKKKEKKKKEIRINIKISNMYFTTDVIKTKFYIRDANAKNPTEIREVLGRDTIDLDDISKFVTLNCTFLMLFTIARFWGSRKKIGFDKESKRRYSGFKIKILQMDITPSKRSARTEFTFNVFKNVTIDGYTPEIEVDEKKLVKPLESDEEVYISKTSKKPVSVSANDSDEDEQPSKTSKTTKKSITESDEHPKKTSKTVTKKSTIESDNDSGSDDEQPSKTSKTTKKSTTKSDNDSGSDDEQPSKTSKTTKKSITESDEHPKKTSKSTSDSENESDEDKHPKKTSKKKE